MKKVNSFKDLFATKEDMDKIEQITNSIKEFDCHKSLRSTVTRDRSSPRLDSLLVHHMSIKKFDKNTLKQIDKTNTSSQINTSQMPEPKHFSTPIHDANIPPPRIEINSLPWCSKSSKESSAVSSNVTCGSDDVFGSPSDVIEQSIVSSEEEQESGTEHSILHSQELLEWKKLTETSNSKAITHDETIVSPEVKKNDTSESHYSQKDTFIENKGSEGDSEIASENSNTESHEEWTADSESAVVDTAGL